MNTLGGCWCAASFGWPRVLVTLALSVPLVGGLGDPTRAVAEEDRLFELQTESMTTGKVLFGHWGPDTTKYSSWGTHSNRLIPVYTYGTKGQGAGVDLDDYTGARSVYRRADGLMRLYGEVPTNTLNPQADYMDQTDLAAMQRAAFKQGKKYVFLIIFDGMDWQTTQAAAIHNRQKIPYTSGRGVGTHFQEYDAAGTSQFGFMVTSPHNDGTKVDVDEQRVLNPGGKTPGGYNVKKAGPNPWTPGDDPYYPINQKSALDKTPNEHAYPDSSATASAMCTGIKTYNNAVNVDFAGEKLITVAHEAQDRGLSIGVVTSVPITHATPACAYAHNVDRDDFQDLTRDMLGLKSIAHPNKPLAGVDVLIGGGFGDAKKVDINQGENFVPGNLWITPDDLLQVDRATGGKYVVAMRTAGCSGTTVLAEAAERAVAGNHRLFGFFGVGSARGHLPFQTADGGYNPPIGRSQKTEKYTAADRSENPALSDMAKAAIHVLSRNKKGFWLMLESGDVDWANHDNNLDNSIGAVNSGDAMVKVVTDWVETHSNWNESLVIVTADHGHYLNLTKPELLVTPK